MLLGKLLLVSMGSLVLFWDQKQSSNIYDINDKIESGFFVHSFVSALHILLREREKERRRKQRTFPSQK